MNFHMNMAGKEINAVKIQRTNKGQWIITVPSKLVSALGISVGEKFEWKIQNDDLLLKRVEK